MENKLKHNFSYISLYCLFFIGNTIINLPFKEHTTGSLLGFIIAFVLGFLLILRLNSINITQKNTVVSKIINFFLCVYALLCGIVTLRNFVTFSDRIILPEISSFFPTLLLLLLVWFLCRQNEKVLLKLSFISTVVVIMLVIILFLFSIKFLSFDFLTKEIPSIKDIVYQSIAYFSMSFIQSIVLLGFIKKAHTSYVGGYILGSAVLFLTLIQCVGTFGFSALSNLSNPYSSAVGIITFGDKYSRLEGFSYFIYFACSLIKTVVSIIAAKNFYCNSIKKSEKFFIPIIIVLYLMISVLTKIFTNLPFANIAPFLIIPPILFIILPKKLYS